MQICIKEEDGINYLKSILKFKKDLFKRGYYSKKDYVVSSLAHIVVCLVPNKLRNLLYKKFLRG